MSDIFSHAPEAEEPSLESDPLTVTVTVAATAEQAFLGWTETIHLWWPLSEFSVSGEDAYVDFEGGELVETTSGDQMISWGSVTTAERPSLLSFSWHPGASALQASQVELRFTEVSSAAGGNGVSATTVALTHSDWAKMEDSTLHRARWKESWPRVLFRYVRFMGGPA